jgi:hypothetical protein
MLKLFESKTFTFGVILTICATLAWVFKGIDAKQWLEIEEWIMGTLGLRGIAESVVTPFKK